MSCGGSSFIAWNKTWTSTSWPGSILPELGRTQYCFGAVVLILKATGRLFGFRTTRDSLTREAAQLESIASYALDLLKGLWKPSWFTQSTLMLQLLLTVRWLVGCRRILMRSLGRIPRVDLRFAIGLATWHWLYRVPFRATDGVRFSGVVGVERLVVKYDSKSCCSGSWFAEASEIKLKRSRHRNFPFALSSPPNSARTTSHVLHSYFY